MVGCGCETTVKFDGLSRAYRTVLWVVVAINGVMFLIEMGAGLAGESQALKADALDFLGDTVTYGMTLAVIGSALAWRARAALVKGASLAVMGLWVLIATGHALLQPGVPLAPVMGSVGALAFAANLVSVLLLLKYRDGDANVRSVWLCSRNDAIGNLAVIAAAAGVWGSGTAWPDIAVAAVMASLFLWSSIQIVSQARSELIAARRANVEL